MRYCVDWTEQRHHLSGALGRAVLDRFLSADWVKRVPRGRAMTVTDDGRAALAELFGHRLGTLTITRSSCAKPEPKNAPSPQAHPWLMNTTSRRIMAVVATTTFSLTAGAVAAIVGLAPLAHAEPDYQQFTSPSGNIKCEMTISYKGDPYANCVARHAAYAVLTPECDSAGSMNPQIGLTQAVGRSVVRRCLRRSGRVHARLRSDTLGRHHHLRQRRGGCDMHRHRHRPLLPCFARVIRPRLTRRNRRCCVTVV